MVHLTLPGGPADGTAASVVGDRRSTSRHRAHVGHGGVGHKLHGVGGGVHRAVAGIARRRPLVVIVVAVLDESG